MFQVRTSAVLALTLAATLIVATSCHDDLGPSVPGVAQLAFAPVFESANAGLVPVTAVRVTAARKATGITVADSVFTIAPNQDSLALGLRVPLVDPGERFLVRLALAGVQGDTVFRGGPIELAAGTNDATPVIPLTYEGVGSDADSVVITTVAPTLFTGGTLVFQAQVFAGDSVVPGAPVAWLSLDTARASVPDYASGQIVAGAQRGAARIVAELLTGPADTSSVLIQPAPASAAVPVGDGQSGEVVLPLPGPVTIRVLGGDGAGVQDAVIRFSGDGTFSPDTGVTDVNGEVQTTWTLGRVAGLQTAVATVDDDPVAMVVAADGADAADATHVSVTVTATGLAGPAVQLGFAAQPVDTTAGVPVPIDVAVQDSLGNTVLPDTGTSVSLAIVPGTGTAGATLLGTIPSLTIGGIASFLDVTPDTLGTAYQLEATASGLLPDTSIAFTIRPGAVATITLTPSADTLDALGAVATYAAVGRDPLNNVIPGLIYQWSSSDSSVAIPDAAGNVTAIGNGTATITASSGAVSGTATIVVQQVATTVTVIPTVATLPLLGDTTRFTATALDANSSPITNAVFAWSLSDSSVASVDATGLVTALGNGTTSVIATVGSASGSATLTVSAGAPAVHWINASGGNWSDSASWNTGAPPIAGDTVYLDAVGTYAVTLDQNADVAELHVGGAGANPTLTIAANVLTVTNGGTVASGATVDHSGGLLALGGVLGVDGAYQWSAGDMQGGASDTLHVRPGATMDISGTTNRIFDGLVLANEGTVTYTGTGLVQTQNGTTFHNLSGGLFNPQTGATWDHNGTGASGFFINDGTILKDGMNSPFRITEFITNNDSIDIQVGSISFSQTSTGTGVIHVASQGNMFFQSGTHTVADSIFGAGSVYFFIGTSPTTVTGFYDVGYTYVQGHTVQFNRAGPDTSITDSLLVGSGGVLTGTGVLRVEGTGSRWFDGTWSGTGSTHIASGASLTIQSSVAMGLDTRRIDNSGTISWTSTIPLGVRNGPTITNRPGGVFDLQVAGTLDSAFGAIGVFLDSGTVRRTSTGVFTMGIPYENAADTLDVQTGTLAFTNTFAHRAGAVIRGNGILDLAAATVTVFDGDVAPGTSPGILGVTGNFAPSTASTLTIELEGSSPGAGAGFHDQLNISGTATLSGTLVLDTLNGYVPAANDSFAIVTVGSRVGNFGTITLPTIAGISLSTAWGGQTPDTLFAIATGVIPPNLNAWINPAGGNWNTATNWSKTSVPSSSDSVVINLPGTYTVTLNTTATVDQLFLGGATGAQTLDHTAGTLNVTNGGVIGAQGIFTENGGILTGSDSLHVDGQYLWTTGTLNGSQSVLHIRAGGIFDIQGAGSRSLDAASIAIESTFGTWSGAGIISSGNGASIDILAGGVLTITENGTLDTTLAGTQTVLLVDGSLVRSTATGTFTLDASLQGSGTIDVQTGTVALRGGGTLLGPLTVQSGAAVVNVAGNLANIGGTTNDGAVSVTGGRYDVGPGTSTGSFTVTNPGELNFNRAHTLDAASSVTGSGTVTFSFSGNKTINGTFNVTTVDIPNGTSGFIFFNSPTNAVVQDFNLSGAGVAGTDTLVVTGNLVWQSGSQNGPGRTRVAASGALFMNSNAVKVLSGREIVLEAPGASWSSNGNVFSGQGGILRLTSGSSFNIGTIGGTWSDNQGGARATIIVEPGAVLTSTSPNTAVGAAVDVAGGAFNVTNGVLSLNGGGTSTGPFNVADGATLNFGAQTQTLNSGSGLAGNGTVGITGGTVVDNAAYSLDTTIVSAGALVLNDVSTSFTNELVLSGGAIDGTATLQVIQGGAWTGGSFLGTGVTRFDSTAFNGFAVAGATPLILTDRTIQSNQTITWSNTGGLTASNATILNTMGGVFDVQSAGSIVQGAVASTFSNSGTLRRTTAAGTFTIDIDFTNFATSLTQLTTGNVTLTRTFDQFANGIIEGNAAGSLDFSTATVGTFAGGLLPGGFGTVDTVNLTGNIPSTASGFLSVDVNSAPAGDQLAVTGSVDLTNLTLNINLLSTTTTYLPGQTFDILTASGGITGSFQAINSLVIIPGVRNFVLSIVGGNTVRLTVQ